MKTIEELHLEAIDSEVSTVQNTTIGKEYAAIESAKITTKVAIDFVNSLRDYERESHTLLGFDERTTEELFEKFLETYNPPY